MPRQIIDTESSRPQYVRRLLITWVVLAILAAILVFAAIAAYGRFARPAHPQAVPTAAVQPMLSSPAPREPQESRLPAVYPAQRLTSVRMLAGPIGARAAKSARGHQTPRRRRFKENPCCVA